MNAAAQNKSFSPHNPALWLRRYSRDLSEKYTVANTTLNSRDVSLNLDLYDLVGVKKERKKRQSPGRSSLCQTSTQFIMPQAALNNKGKPWFLTTQLETTFWFSRQLDVCGEWRQVRSSVGEDRAMFVSGHIKFHRVIYSKESIFQVFGMFWSLPATEWLHIPLWTEIHSEAVGCTSQLRTKSLHRHVLVSKLLCLYDSR